MPIRFCTSKMGREAERIVRIEDAKTGGELGGSESGWLLNSQESIVMAKV